MPQTSELLTSAKGDALALNIFSPDEAQTKRGVVLIAAAMGVPQRYYAPFATWLAQQGFVVATFDYSGMGQSLTAAKVALKQVSSDMLDWAHEAGEVLTLMKRRYPEIALYWVGHSFGGQILPMVDHSSLRKAITVGTGSGYWKENSPQLRRRVWLLWYFLVPLLTPIMGYFPGKRLKMVGDLPARVMLQWRRWCMNAGYNIGVEGEPLRAQYAAVRTPITSLSFTDDDYMSAKNTEQIHGFYINARKNMQRIAPQDAGVTHIGHFGFFKAHFKDTLWHKLLAELNETSIVNREDTL